MKRVLQAIAVCLLFASIAAGQTLQFEVQGGPQLTIRAKAEQQQWLVLGGKTIVAAVVDGQLVLQQWAMPSPGPIPPDPGPNPPDPGPLPDKWQVAIILETDALDNLPADQQKLLASILVRDELASRGHKLVGILDPDSAATASEALKPWFDSAKGKQLPLVALAPLDGGTIYTFPLPQDTAGLWKLLEKPKIGDPSPFPPPPPRRLPPVQITPPIVCPGGVCP